MEAKIKIYIPENVYNILLKDMERFEICKKDGSLNKNEFYNTLIVNYYEQYQDNRSSFFEHIRKTIKEGSHSSRLEIDDMAYRILQFVDIKTNQLDSQKSEVALSMKPTKKSSNAISFIEHCCLNGSTLSNYFRNMFASYTMLPQDKRERIIFKNSFELIEKAIENNRKIYFETAGKDAAHIASPYAICNSKEELFNYLLADYNDYPFSFRISRLEKIAVLNEPRQFKENNISIFEKMIKNGPQFAYKINKEAEEIEVELSDKGKQMYKAIYLHRPQYTRIEGNRYYFECSLQQAYQYFARFGSNAIVTSPSYLTEDLHRLYALANKK